MNTEDTSKLDRIQEALKKLNPNPKTIKLNTYSDQIFIGKTQYGDYIDEKGDSYQYISADQTANGDAYLMATYNGAESIAEALTDDDDVISGAYITEGLNCCESCGLYHDTQDGQPTYVIINDCELLCKDCVSIDEMMMELKTPADVFKAKDIRDLDTPEYEMVEELFCDNSGLGGSNEPASTKNQTIVEVEQLMAEHDKLYVGLIGIGQFQVYVGVFIKKEG
ncbi:hypothetical protein DRH14_03600 [Candidatus Shapirobacteria bacterium]|nr:MAG: hypothetical protein DRH14_03600 [Candidatus Shapirobacteria bacterium]